MLWFLAPAVFVSNVAFATVPGFAEPVPLLGSTQPGTFPQQGGGSVSDLDGDGDWDLVLPQRRSVVVLLQEGRTADGLPSFQPLDTGPTLNFGNEFSAIRGTLAADLNEDGFPDLVLWSTRFIRVLEHEGTTPPSWRQVPAVPDNEERNVEGGGVLDLDRDGRLEVVLPHTQDDAEVDLSVVIDWDPRSNAWVDQGPGFIEFEPQVGDYLVVADVDGDADTDLVLRTGVSPHVNLHDGTPDGRMIPHPSQWTFGTENEIKAGLVACDIDADADLDLYWPNAPLTLAGESQEGLWLNDGTGDFTEGPLFGDGEESTSAACGDLDHDGIFEIVLTGQTRTTVWRSVPGGYEPQLLGEPGLTVAMADLDDDGDLDLLTTDDRQMVPAALFWPNPLAPELRDRHLQVRLQHVSGSCEAGDRRVRDDFGSQVVLQSERGDVWGLREVMGAEGRGQTGWPVLHWGGVDPDAQVRLSVTLQASSERFELELVPRDLGEDLHRLVITSDDLDGDGILNVDERAFGDLDGDGVSAELDRDSDGDGLSDAEEAGDRDRCTPPADMDASGIPDAFEAPFVNDDTGGEVMEEDGPVGPSARGQGEPPLTCGCQATPGGGIALSLGLWLVLWRRRRLGEARA
ncbi:MAG: FG-GAP-like repeat-containing protein [Myxococcota bacterium]